MEKISQHISVKEAIFSATAQREGIDNKPNATQLKAMKLTAEKVFEPLRNHFNVPIAVTSFFRNKELNTVLKGSKTSQHMKGEAIDIDGDVYGRLENSQIFNWIKDNLEFDQLIWEYGNDTNPAWVHVSFSSKKNRKKILKAVKGKGYVAFK